MNNRASFEWYISEGHGSESSSGWRPGMRFGPFSTEADCRVFVENVRQIPRFSNSVFRLEKWDKRRDTRIKAEYPVVLYRPGTHEESATARTIDVSASGVRLRAAKPSFRSGEVLMIEYDGRTAPFQVIWTCSGEMEDEAGLECLSPEVNIWNLNLSGQSEHERLKQEIFRARGVQSRLFPNELPKLQTLDYSGHCSQARTVGGDYYDFLSTGPGEVGFVLADVSGKGLAAALLMANLHGIVQAQCTLGCKDLSRLLASINCHLYRHTDADRYATVFFGCYDDSTRTLRYGNCGHCPPLILRHNGVTEKLEATAAPLGLFRDWAGSVIEVQVEPGDIVSMFTDGIIEAAGENGQEFGEGRLINALRGNSDLNAAAILERLEQAVEQFRSGEQHDDAALVIARSR